uniref:C2H2-type domain-containing protein n=1 Tax=Schistocephalus solidus TaxID=70667 RepID=A0A0X3PG46_SCHSO
MSHLTVISTPDFHILCLPFAVRNKYCCQICNNTFSVRSSVGVHIRTVHEGLKCHKCPFCCKAFSRKDVLCRHIETIHEENRSYPCGVCFKMFSNRASASVHLRTVHEATKNYKCAVCGKAFSRNDVLRRHLETVHGEEKVAESQKSGLQDKAIPSTTKMQPPLANFSSRPPQTSVFPGDPDK